MEYKLVPGQPSVLPCFKPSTERTLLIPRPDTALATVIAPAPQTITNLDMAGKWSSTHIVKAGSFHVVPQVGCGYVADPEDVQTMGNASPRATFLLGEQAVPSARRTITPVLYTIWSRFGYQDVAVHDLFRIAPAMVIGEIAPEAAPGLLQTQHGTALRINFGGWPRERLLLVCEQSEGEDETYRGIRLVPLTYLVREFASWVSQDGTVIEEFKVALT